MKIKRYRRTSRRKQKGIMRNTIIVMVVLTFGFTIGYSAFSTTLSIGAKGNIKEKSRVIQSWTSSSNEDFHTDFYRENIVSVTFLDSAKVPSNKVESWDVSVNKDGGVMAYVVENSSETGKYDLFIGAKDGVIANEDSSALFYKFTATKTIKFNHNYDTRNVVSMYAMFWECISLTELDLSDFNTSNVTNMNGAFTRLKSLETLDLSMFNTSNVLTMENMFLDSSGITSLNISSFNTSKVKNMKQMFQKVSVFSLDLSHFDTSDVTNMYLMFNGCYNLETLDVSSFDTTNVINMYGMFNSCTKLKTIWASNKFNTASVTNSADMFYSDSKLVGGNGTCYSSEHVDKEYARIDTASSPGYFTAK